ncbi:Nuclear protein localization protein 4 [Perkinsus olseni]|uniref:Nuclear protein localization protein 4 n=1 Tax=Perkinsus olseni TaxID=32597 RepID=A0A7J6LDI1_PEROL|nr:Nuclear protein localization protein 4 [Perkinsus olseni]KAF4662292.1 Nuclear protein localization protein 4 [Perkinsus olseni]
MSSSDQGDQKATKRNFQSFESYLKDHKYETSLLPLSQHYKPVVLEKGRMTKLPPALTLNRQRYRHVDHCEWMNTEEIKSFVQYWQYDKEMLQQRCGWLYGYYLSDPNYDDGCRIVVEGIYEPPKQELFNAASGGLRMNEMLVAMQEASSGKPSSGIPGGEGMVDPDLAKIDAVMAKLGLERVGCIMTSLPRDYEMSSGELLASARLQKLLERREHYTGYPVSKFVTAIVKPNEEKQGQPETMVWMASDQAEGMLQDGLFDVKKTAETPTRVQLREPFNQEMMPPVLASGSEVTEFDPDWLLVKVNDGVPLKKRSMFRFSHFPRENRSRKQTPDDIKQYMRQIPAGTPSWARYADFHLLVYITLLLDEDTAGAIAGCISREEEIDKAMDELLTNMSA